MRQLVPSSFLFVLVLFCALCVHATEKFKCGEYSIRGLVKKSADHFVVKLYEGSMSEVTLSLPLDLEEAIQIYEDRPVTLHAKMLAPVKNMQGQVQSLLSEEEAKNLLSSDQPYSARFFREDIQERVPDPLRPELDSGMDLIKETPCGKSTPTLRIDAKNKKGRS